MFNYRYSGEHREISEKIDDVANITWENVSIFIDNIYYINLLMYTHSCSL